MVLRRLRDYELVMVINPEADESQVAAMVERVTHFVTERGGTITEQANWGIRRLAYPIRRFQEGNYALTRFVLDAKDVLELERTLEATEDVLRHLVTKVDKSVVKKNAAEGG